MNSPLEITRGIYEKSANLAYFDLCGIKSLYKNRRIPNETKSIKIFKSLLIDFDDEFTNYFKKETKDCFNINIYADSIIICQRPQARINNFFERMVDFFLLYQFLLFQNRIISRALLDRDSFFYFHVKSAPPDSILSSQMTNISLCGGKGLAVMDEILKGLPLGVYVSKNIIKELSANQRRRILKVQCSHLFFIRQEKQKAQNMLHHHLSEPLLGSLLKKSQKGKKTLNPTEEDIVSFLKKSGFKDEEIKKSAPWFLVNLGIRKTIEREHEKKT